MGVREKESRGRKRQRKREGEMKRGNEYPASVKTSPLY